MVQAEESNTNKSIFERLLVSGQKIMAPIQGMQ
jgi:hypothetical protein